MSHLSSEKARVSMDENIEKHNHDFKPEEDVLESAAERGHAVTDEHGECLGIVSTPVQVTISTISHLATHPSLRVS